MAAFRTSLEERTHERVPLHWAATQNNLGNALRILGERETVPSTWNRPYAPIAPLLRSGPANACRSIGP